MTVRIPDGSVFGGLLYLGFFLGIFLYFAISSAEGANVLEPNKCKKDECRINFSELDVNCFVKLTLRQAQMSSRPKTGLV
jgi:hypothetical protein